MKKLIMSLLVLSIIALTLVACATGSVTSAPSSQPVSISTASSAAPESTSQPPASSSPASQGDIAPTDLVEPEAVFDTPLLAISSTELHLRKGPGTQYESILLIPQDKAVTEIGYLNDDYLWMYVEYDGHRGWADSEWLALVGPGYDPAELVQPNYELKEPTILTTTETLHLRNGPGTNYDIILTLPKDSQLTELGRFRGISAWMYVDYAGTKGWVDDAWVNDD